MQVTVIWDVTLRSLVGVLLLIRNVLPTGFSETLAYFYMAIHPSTPTSVITTAWRIHGANLCNFLDATVTST